MAQLIRFGIPSLDRLLGRRANRRANSDPRVDDFGIELASRTATTSFCLIGPDGTGKSVLALHLASRYLADCHPTDGDCETKVLYISTDLTSSKANQIWKNFALGNPKGRNNPFEESYRTGSPSKIDFEPIKVENAQALARYLRRPRLPTVAFVDLAESSAGDDWASMNRILAGLSDETLPRHLLIIDAIEGFETLVGERDAYGEKLSRRSRIAQVMRLAAGRCHVVFVVEESAKGVRQPEEFVTDVVIRLHSVEVNRYSRRTVEVEKVRGQSHARGQHSFTIRKGKGSTTGRGPDSYGKYFINYDDPKVPGGDPKNSRGAQSYVLVFPSLHFQSRELMERREPEAHKPNPQCAGFGIRYLDEMLVEGSNRTRGLPVGKVTALIGDLGTQRTGLGHSFLAECFAGLGKKLLRILEGSTGSAVPSSSGMPACTDLATWCLDCLAQRYRDKAEELSKRGGFAEELAKALDDVGVAVLLTTTQDIDPLSLAEEFSGWLCKEVSLLKTQNTEMLKLFMSAVLVTRIVCRRLEVHDLSSAVLMHIVSQAVKGARQRIREQIGISNSVTNRSTGQIRVVIDDFSTWKEIYPDIRNEPLFLPSLLFYLRREDVVTLIIDSHPGRPDMPVTDPFDSELRALVDYAIYTWRVLFYGESRIAIAPMPPLSNGLSTGVSGSAPISVVRELKWSPPELHKKRPEVDPHFELYAGLEEGKPKPIELEVRLYGEKTPEFRRFIKDQNSVLAELFTPTSRLRDVIRPVFSKSYDTLRDSCAIQSDTRLDHTLIVQTDEFWSLRSRGRFRPQKPYLDTITWQDGVADQTEDAFGLFRPGLESDWKRPTGSRRRVDFFEQNGYLLKGEDGRAFEEIDRIPFAWDFGLLLCNLEAWTTSGDEDVELWPNQRVRVRDVWDGLPKAFGRSDDLGRPHRGQPICLKARPSWRQFLGACKMVHHLPTAGGIRDVVPFDAALTTAESFSSLVMEVWASETFRRLRREQKESLTKREWVPPKRAVFSLRRYAIEFYLTWLLLADALDLTRFADSRRPFDPVTSAPDKNAIAVRHWYKSACIAQAESKEVLVPVGLPGHFTVRGDWFLAVASASRSSRLADRALDLLNSRRGHFVRMQLGLGLPARDIAKEYGDRLRTRIVSPCQTENGALDPGRITNVAYADLCEIGEHADQEFFWLWRSAFRDYDSLAKIWQKWLVRMTIAWNDFRQERGASWVSGLDMYDRLCYYMGNGNPPQPQHLLRRMGESTWGSDDPNSFEQFSTSWDEFGKLYELVVRLFQQAMD